MDGLSHLMAGAAMASSGLSARFGRGTTLAFILGSVAPDVDNFLVRLYVTDGMGFLERRTFTHSVLGIPILAIIGALLFRRFYRETPWRRFFLVFLLAGGVHVFFDLLNSYGVCILYPFSDHRFELAWVFIIDLAFWGILLLPLLISVFAKKWRSRLGQVSLVVLALYIGLCGAGSIRAGRVLESIDPDAELAYVFPEALGNHRFRGVLKERSEYRLYLIQVVTGRWEPWGVERSDDDDPAVRALRASEWGRKLDWFFKAPVWKVGSSGRIDAYDLRFRSTLFEGRDPFRFQFQATPDGFDGPYRVR